MPHVTVLMAVYNGERYLREAIESILVQSYQDFELLIVNDGSTDRTRDIILSYRDGRIRLLDNEGNIGLTKSLNRGLRLAQGELVARQDADDLSEPDRLARQVAFMERHPEVALLGTWYKEIDASGALTGYGRLPCELADIRWSLLFFSPFVHSAVMLRKPLVLERAGFYDESLIYSQDYELWRRIARSLPVANLDEYLVRLRITPHSMTSTYGDAADEGRQMRIAAMSEWLGWEEAAPVSADRFDTLYAFLYGSRVRFSLQEVLCCTEAIRALEPAFRRRYGVSASDWRRQQARLHARVSWRLAAIARSSAARGEYGEALRLVAQACRTYGPIVPARAWEVVSRGLLPRPSRSFDGL